MQLDKTIKKRKSVNKFLNKKPNWRNIIECIDKMRYSPMVGNNFILKVINRAGFFNSNFIDFTMPNNYYDLVNIIRKYYNFKESIPFSNHNSGNDLIYFYNDKVEFLKLK
jgi:hypothetical protein